MAFKRKRRKRGSSEAKLNITSMMDMFTIILVFLLKSFSAQGQIIAPAKGLTMPNAHPDSSAVQALSIDISVDHKEKGQMRPGVIMVEGKSVMPTNTAREAQGFLLPELREVLQKYSDEAQKTSAMYRQEFKGDINIQADTGVTYDIITKVMFTCGQTGFPNMQMVVYKEE